MLLGHWVLRPDKVLIYAHCKLVIKNMYLDMIYLVMDTIHRLGLAKRAFT